MPIALTRMPTEAIRHCELTHLEREPIDVERAREQHGRYERELESLGCTIERLPELADCPDAVFVEDTTVVLPELAVITRPGASSRRPETETVARALARYRSLSFIRAPATLDGGDVLRVGRTLYVGVSGRTNRAGIEQLRAHVEPYGHDTIPVELRGCLHLKTAVAEVGEGTVLINPDWVDAGAFGGLRVIEIEPGEVAATSLLRIGDDVLMTTGSPRTRELLEGIGCRVREIDYTELAKAESGLTCCSVIFESGNPA